jgi:hypothetical protein
MYKEAWTRIELKFPIVDDQNSSPSISNGRGKFLCHVTSYKKQLNDALENVCTWSYVYFIDGRHFATFE